jgi:hypothetical protein
MATAPTESLVVGSRIPRAGFFTKLYLLGDVSDGFELERRLGYKRGRLSRGWYLLLLLGDPPAADEFEFAGYSHFSGGRIRGHQIDPLRRGPTVEEDLRTDGLDVAVLRSATAKRFVTQGPERVAKVVPRLRDTDAHETSIQKGKYWNTELSPIAQWVLTRPREFLVQRAQLGYSAK